MMADYGTLTLPARPRRPRDKAKVVVVERWLLGRLRHSTFRSLAEVSAAIALLLTRLTNRPARRNPSQSAAGDRPNCRQECWRNAERAAVVRNA
jgi:hypothetical protein